MRESALRELESQLEREYGKPCVTMGAYRPSNKFKLAMWLLGCTGIVVIWVLIIALKAGAESLLSIIGMMLIPTLFVFGFLFLLCNPFPKDFIAYFYRSCLVINNNGAVQKIAIGDIDHINHCAWKTEGVRFHRYGAVLKSGDYIDLGESGVYDRDQELECQAGVKVVTV